MNQIEKLKYLFDDVQKLFNNECPDIHIEIKCSQSSIKEFQSNLEIHTKQQWQFSPETKVYFPFGKITLIRTPWKDTCEVQKLFKEQTRWIKIKLWLKSKYSQLLEMKRKYFHTFSSIIRRWGM